MKSCRPGCLALLASLMQLAIAVDLAALDPGLLQQFVLAPVFPCSLSQRCLQPGIEPARPDAQATTHRIPSEIRARHCARSNGAHGLPLSGCHISRRHVPVPASVAGSRASFSRVTRRRLRELALPGIEGVRADAASLRNLLRWNPVPDNSGELPVDGTALISRKRQCRSWFSRSLASGPCPIISPTRIPTICCRATRLAPDGWPLLRGKRV